MENEIITLSEYKATGDRNLQKDIYSKLIDSIIKVAEDSTAENTQEAINLAWELFKADDRITLMFED